MFRFTIRDVRLLTLVAAIAVAWLVERRGWRVEREKLIRQMQVLEVTLVARDAEARAMEAVAQVERAESDALMEQIKKLKGGEAGR